MKIAAIDQGTTSTRVLVATADGRADIRHAVRHEQIYPQAGWVEHNPLELINNIQQCIEAAGPVDAIGIDNQGESCLAWDAKTGEPLSPVIVWQDNRTADKIEQMRAEGLEQLTLARAGLPLDPYFSASKLSWLLQNNQAVKQAYRDKRLRLGTTDAYFLERLTGHFYTDATTASRTSLMNLKTGQWDAELCQLFGVPIETLPEIRATVGEFGHYLGIPITASVVDQQAALYGHGCRQVGDAKITFGTGAFTLAVTGSRIVSVPECGLLPTIAWRIGNEITYAVDGGVYDASAAVEWGKQLGLFNEYADIASFRKEAAISRELAFVPALSGLACPYWDRSAAAIWVGMNASTSREDLCQSLLEGVALRTAEVVSAMNEQVSICHELPIDGGLARNVYFNQFLADILGRSVVTRSFDELTAFGCASFAALGLGKLLERPQATTLIFTPKQSKETAVQWRNQFSNAVTRARAWR